MRGAYLACIENWCSVFPNGQLQLIVFDDIEADPRDVLTALAEHLQIDPAPFLIRTDAALSERIFAGNGTPLRPSLRAYLCRVYAPDIGVLASRLGRDLSHWLDTSG